MVQDELAGLSVFLVVAEMRSFTAAARKLRVTPSAVSQSITGLEGRVGVRLLQRTTRSVGLTEAGARFLERLRPAIADVRASFEALDALRDRPAGTLRINVPRLVCRQILEPVLAPFMAAYPEIAMDIVVDDGLADIVEEGFDCGIRLGETLDREMVAVRISGEQRVAVVGSPSYFAVRGKPKHPRELHAHECINYRQITRRAVYKWEFTEQGKDFEIAVDGRVVCNDADLMVRAALDGLGLAYLLEASVRSEMADKRLLRVLDAFCAPFPGFFLYYPSRSLLSPKLRALVDFLKKPAKRR
jgi:DNA-binding transcriptional LysR family regulator